MMFLPQSLSDMGTQDILLIIVMMTSECVLEHHGGKSGYFRQYLSLPVKYLRHDRRVGDEMSAQNSLSIVYGAPHIAFLCSLHVLVPYSCIISHCSSLCQDINSAPAKIPLYHGVSLAVHLTITSRYLPSEWSPVPYADSVGLFFRPNQRLPKRSYIYICTGVR